MVQVDEPVPRKYLSPQDISDELGIPLKTIYLWISRRQFPYARLGKHIRILPSDLETWIDSKTVSPAAHPDNRGNQTPTRQPHR